MAGLGDVLRHLVKYALGLGEQNRAEFLDAINEAFPVQEQPAPAPPAPPPVSPGA